VRESWNTLTGQIEATEWSKLGMAPTCINLKERFGDRFKVQYEESYYAERGERAWTDDPWLQTIPCENGHIGPFGGEELAACTNSARSIPQKLLALGCCRLWQDGSDGANLVFHLRDFDRVAAVMKPRRKRHGRPMTDEERATFIATGTAALARHRESTSQAVSGGRSGVSSGRADSEHVQPVLTQNSPSEVAFLPGLPP
jgi:hypothetical protein